MIRDKTDSVTTKIRNQVTSKETGMLTRYSTSIASLVLTTTVAFMLRL